MNTVVLHLSLIPDFGPALFDRLLSVVGPSRLNELYQWSLQDFMYRAGFSEKTGRRVVEGLFDQKPLQNELALIEKNCIRWVTILDSEYPLVLKNTHLPPLVLYWRGGDLSILEKSFAVVGSRKANGYGRSIIECFVPELLPYLGCLVSGGAIGADTMAHEIALRYQGLTCAVIGSGLLRPYPARNKVLFEEIIARGGIVMSPFPLKMEALPGNFPARNRIISGLSKVILVVQAAQKSGALITAFYALEQGREVCAVPGPIGDELSHGCHFLIQEGACLVQHPHDILRVCNIEASPEHERVALQAEVAQDPLLAACIEPQLFDDLRAVLGYDEIQLQEKLLMLQLEGILDQDVMGRWYVVK